MRRRLSVALLPLALLALAVPASADARKLSRWRHLWATVNICDTAKHPDAIGIRASMPGLGKKRMTLWMRFRVQYRSARDREWKAFTVKGTDSGFIRIARRGDIKSRQSGYIFLFDPRRGDKYVLRGHVTFQWRRGGRVVLRRRELTTPGHNVHVADPKGYSRRRCEIRGKPER